MIILIIVSFLYLAKIIRKKLKKETIEVEDVLHKNIIKLKDIVNNEIMEIKLKKLEDFSKEKSKAKSNLKNKIDEMEIKILKEIKDVENILK